MPINVATGVVSLTREDARIPGHPYLTWERSYSTARLDPPGSPLGSGWTVRYFTSLARVAEGYRLLTPDGATFVFEDPTHRVERGELVRHLGSFQELRKEAGRYVVIRWDVADGKIERYVFQPAGDGRSARLAAIEDVIGRGLDLEYDRTGRLTGVIQRRELRSLRLSYLPSGLVGTVTFRAADGSTETVVGYSYDATGRLTADVSASGFTNRYEYDSAGRITREEAKDGGVFTYIYDGRGRCIRFSGLGRYNEKTLRYVDAARLTYVTNSTGGTSIYESLPTGQLVREVNPAGEQTRTEYDEHLRVVARVGARGGVIRYGFDEAGNLTSITDPLGHGFTLVYNDARLTTTVINPNGHVWSREYDSDNRLTAVVDPKGARWTIGYDASGNATTFADPAGNLLRQRFSAAQVVEWTDWAGNPTRFEYDRRGRLTAWTDPTGARVALRRDAAGNPVEVRWPDETVTRATYDAAGNLTTYTDAAGRTTRYQFAPCGRLLAQENPDGTRLEYLWETEPERLAGVINENGEALTLTRDAAGRVVREVGFDGRETSFEYDPDGNCVAVVTANRERIVREFDSVGRLTGIRLPDGTASTYAYDPAGRMVAAVNADAVVTFAHDPTGRVVRQTQGDQWVASEYDAGGNLVRTSTSLGHDVRYDNDPNGRIVRLATAGREVTFGRDARGAETRRVLPGGVELNCRYDPLGRLLEQTARRETRPGGELVRREYGYEPSGLLRTVADSYWGPVEFDYDPVLRLRHALRAHGPREQFGYDPAGNLTVIRRDGQRATDEEIPHGPGNRIERAAAAVYEYDPQGRVVRVTREPAGRPAEVWRYEWNAHDQLRSVVRPDGERWEYKYDAFGRRVEKAGPGRRTTFVWDGEVLIHTTDGADDVATWVTDPRKFTPYAKVRNGKLYSVVTDHLGTPRELIGPDGAIAWRASYLAWGEVEREELLDPDADCPFRFPGQWFDSETGLHYNWYRYYDPRVGAYLCQDPIRLAGGINPYLYTINPVNGIDPFGLVCHKDTNGGQGYAIYAIVDENGHVVYVGMTNNMDARRAQHSEPGGRLDPNHPDASQRNMVQIDHVDNYGQARGHEQAWMEHFGTKPDQPGVAARGADGKPMSPADYPANRADSFNPDRGTRPTDPARDRAFQDAYANKMADLGH
jgi:RHS repeat-associated protein